MQLWGQEDRIRDAFFKESESSDVMGGLRCHKFYIRWRFRKGWCYST